MEKETEIISNNYEFVFPKPEQSNFIQGAVDLVNHFYKSKLLLPADLKHYEMLAGKKNLIVAINNDGKLIGSSAYTQFFEKDIWEFGGWTVDEEYQHKGIGTKIIKKLFEEQPHIKTIAFGNKNSGPIFEYLNAEIITDHSLLPKQAFNLCNGCPNKPTIGCCDTIYNLAPIVHNVMIEKMNYDEKQLKSLLIYQKDLKNW